MHVMQEGKGKRKIPVSEEGREGKERKRKEKRDTPVQCSIGWY